MPNQCHTFGHLALYKLNVYAEGEKILEANENIA